MFSEQLICVPPQQVDIIWPHVCDLIERAIIGGHSDYPLDYVKRRLDDKESLLWVVWNGKTLMAAGTTEITGLVGVGRVCVITTCAGRNLRRWDRFLADIETYAKAEQCTRVRLYGRMGWARYLRTRGYVQPWIALEKSMI